MKCSGKSFKEIRARDVQAQYCTKCSVHPLSDSFFNDSDIEGDTGQVQVEGGTEAENEIWADFDQKANNHRSNLKLGHINANSIGGFKFNEIKTWLQSGRLDVLIISETKIDATFPNSMFHVEGFRLCRCDRKETVEAVHAPPQLSNLTQSKYPIAPLYLGILETCLFRSISCRNYIDGTDKWNRLFTGSSKIVQIIINHNRYSSTSL